jgi:hypothetical protein
MEIRHGSSVFCLATTTRPVKVVATVIAIIIQTYSGKTTTEIYFIGNRCDRCDRCDGHFVSKELQAGRGNLSSSSPPPHKTPSMDVEKALRNPTSQCFHDRRESHGITMVGIGIF